MFANLRKFMFKFPKLLWKLFTSIRGGVSKLLGNPSIVATIHERKVYMPMYHNLPINVSRFKFYDTAITRVADFLRQEKESITYIDVGANIGDTILAISPTKKDKIIGVEPSSEFDKYLKRNLKEYSNVVIENVICSSSSKEEKMKMVQIDGTAHVVKDDDSEVIKRDTLDNLVRKNNLKEIDFIKVDTDGHDFEVLRGSKATIKKYKPAIFFECDMDENENYVKDIFEFFDYLMSCGYKSIIMYDNYGYLFGKFNLKDKDVFDNLFFYQLNSDFYYYDILVMEEESIQKFWELERTILQYKPER